MVNQPIDRTDRQTDRTTYAIGRVPLWAWLKIHLMMHLFSRQEVKCLSLMSCQKALGGPNTQIDIILLTRWILAQDTAISNPVHVLRLLSQRVFMSQFRWQFHRCFSCGAMYIIGSWCLSACYPPCHWGRGWIPCKQTMKPESSNWGFSFIPAGSLNSELSNPLWYLHLPSPLYPLFFLSINIK